MRWLGHSIIYLVCLTALSGCARIPQRGSLDKVQPVSDKPRAGNVYLLRGFIGVFSTGIDDLGMHLREVGMRAYVFQESQAMALARRIREEYQSHPEHEPLVLIGHSYGADSVIRIARELDRAGIPVDLLVTLDPVTPPSIPNNVRNALNIYQSNKFWDRTPFLRGVPVSADPQFTGRLDNLNIRENRTDLLTRGLDHFNIEKQPKIHEEVIGHVLIVCPPRPVWLASRTPQRSADDPRLIGARLPAGAPAGSTHVAHQGGQRPGDWRD